MVGHRLPYRRAPSTPGLRASRGILVALLASAAWIPSAISVAPSFAGPSAYPASGVTFAAGGVAGVPLAEDSNGAQHFAAAQATGERGSVAGLVPRAGPQPPGLTVSPITAAPPAVDIGQKLDLSVTVSGERGPPIYYWAGLPRGCLSRNSNVLTCSPTANGNYTASVQVWDHPHDFATSPPLPLNVSPDPNPPRVSASPARVSLGEATNFTAVLSGGAPPYLLSWLNLPAGCVSKNVRVLACLAGSAGSYNITVKVTDANGLSAESSRTSFVVQGGLSLPLLATSRLRADVGQTVFLNVTHLGGSGPINYTWKGLPPGCESLSGPNLTCGPNEPGVFGVYVTAVDSVGDQTVSPTVSLNVTLPPSIHAVNPGALAFDVGRPGTFSLSYSVGSGGGELLAVAFPGSCTPVKVSGTTLTCTPDEVGSFQFNVTLNDSNGWVTTFGPLTAVVNPLLVIESFTASSPIVTVNGSVMLSVVSVGGAPPLSFLYQGLPTGCQPLDASSVTCTPIGPGTYSITVSVTDAAGITLTSSTGLTVTGAESNPVNGTQAAPSGSLSGAALDPVVLAAPLLLIIAASAFFLVLRRRSRGGSEIWTVAPSAAVAVGSPPESLGPTEPRATSATPEHRPGEPPPSHEFPTEPDTSDDGLEGR